jgi:F5/8 type C domain
VKNGLLEASPQSPQPRGPNPESRIPGPLFIFAAFLALSILWTWPVAAHLTSRVPHDAGDPLLNVWILWWNAEAVPLSDRWWNPPMMWPMPGAMALSEHLLGLSVLATPLQLAGAGVLTAHNVVLLLTYALSAQFAYLLVKRLTGSSLAGICAGLAFGFSPYRASQLSHIQVLAAQWMPLALLSMHAYISTGLPRWLIVFGLAWLLQALSNGYFLLFFPILIVLWLLWFVDWRNAPRRGGALAIAWAAASLPLLPILWKYHLVHSMLGLRRTVPEIREFSATTASFVHASPLMRLWPEGRAANFELFLFPGVTVVLLAAFALAMVLVTKPWTATRERSPILFYVFGALLMAALALGPGGQGHEPASLLHPFSWLLWLPGFDGIRVTARFAMIATLCLAIAAGLGLARLMALAGRARLLVAALAIAGLTADGLTEPVPVLSPPGRLILPPVQDPAVVELPMDNIYVSVAAMYRSMSHGQPLVNGYSGHFPPHYNVLTLSLARGDVSGLLYLARQRPLVIIVNDLLDPGRGYRTMVESIPGIKPQSVTAGGSMFLLPAQPAPRVPPVGQPVRAEVRDAGRYLLEFDLGAVHGLSAIEFPLRTRYEDFASRLRIETSDDGQAWREAWVGWTGGLAVEATLADPKVASIRLPIPGTRARYVRVYPASTWMKDELVVRGAE